METGGEGVDYVSIPVHAGYRALRQYSMLYKKYYCCDIQPAAVEMRVRFINAAFPFLSHYAI